MIQAQHASLAHELGQERKRREELEAKLDEKTRLAAALARERNVFEAENETLRVRLHELEQRLAGG